MKQFRVGNTNAEIRVPAFTLTTNRTVIRPKNLLSWKVVVEKPFDPAITST
jgi:hypothetical protein